MLFKKISFWLLCADIVLLAAGSVIERLSGAQIYTSPLAVALWGATALAASAAIIKARLIKRPALFLLHFSLILMLAGAAVTHFCGTDETIDLRLREPVTLSDGDLTIELTAFELDCYPGTSIARNYLSTLKISSPSIPTATGTTALNNVLEINGYRFFQMAYDSDANGSVIQVSHDPAGNVMTLTSYALLFLSLVLIFIPRKLLAKPAKGIAACLLLATAPAAAYAQNDVLPDSIARRFGDIMVMHNQRVAPLSTLARDFTVKVTGKDHFREFSAEQFFTAHLFYPYSWMESLTDSPSDPESRESRAIRAMAANGTLWKIFPVTDSGGETEWYSPTDGLPADLDEARWQFIRLTPNYLAELVANREWDKVNGVIHKIIKYQQQTVPAAIPSRIAVTAERIYCRCSSMPLPPIFFTMCAMILFFYTRRPILASITDILGISWTALLIAANWTATGQLPMAGGHETMYWLALLAFILPWTGGKKLKPLMPMAILTGAFALQVAKMGASAPQLTPLQPVLRSPLLSLHVLTIMLSYAMMMLMCMCGIATLCGRKQFHSIGHRLLKPAVSLLAAGIFIGAIWANNSWGRYWAWDPKEVWALITMLIYCYPLHYRLRRNTFAIFCIVAFLSVIMTYFGVNTLLGGLHSYNN